MKRALITGITGQDGSYLAELLIHKGYEVYGLVRRSSTKNYWRIEHIIDDINLIEGDMLDETSLYRAVQISEPDECYNLAAQSHVGTSFKQPIFTAECTGMGTLKLLEALYKIKPDVKFYQASTSELFGKVEQIPQNEHTPFHPRSPYGVAKLYAHWITINFREAYNMHTNAGILFNHESERRATEFVTRKITQSVAKIKFGLQKELRLGNLEAKRDWGYAEDYVYAMWLMLQQDQPSDYVIATGETHSVREFCKIAFEMVDLNYEDYVVVDPKFYRPSEVDLLVGDSWKAKTYLGWKPKVSFRDLIRRMVMYDCSIISPQNLKKKSN